MSVRSLLTRMHGVCSQFENAAMDTLSEAGSSIPASAGPHQSPGLLGNADHIHRRQVGHYLMSLFPSVSYKRGTPLCFSAFPICWYRHSVPGTVLGFGKPLCRVSSTGYSTGTGHGHPRYSLQDH
jgi:hypothetical protein